METEGERSGASVWTEDTPQSPPQNYYDILGVPKNADSDQIRRSYRKAALRCHPVC
ncbi:hypothetical protein BC830DRAFT_1117992 [Chytriomyces sp. MP71]|nr:hypothetical protein BC830DRAFT_1117992 [Chytriomyces sp. MP71]